MFNGWTNDCNHIVLAHNTVCSHFRVASLKSCRVESVSRVPVDTVAIMTQKIYTGPVRDSANRDFIK